MSRAPTMMESPMTSSGTIFNGEDAVSGDGLGLVVLL
jgi:hypothetical protein